ncbi:S1C family serine protease [Nannocystis pusilla]|uniref:Trypsin-like peptidase domain-containing protein n=1 Tax=Nannocystis pusilla TaxID=889268 RepID=A0ABS7THF1_9BACT|nr:trypsin-like peptidase domain-containing protein [Nannocystis pusilla]MBZ5707652.1 trypsin-like peptidase domain-containing protein [Nannocystis pusilla]
MAASRRTLLSTSLVLLGCLTVLPGMTECQAAAPPSPRTETVTASAPREIAPDVGAHATLTGVVAAPSQPAATPEVKRPSPAARLEAEQNVIDVFRAAAPATVFVTQKRVVRDYSMRALEVPAGSGTGFVWDTQGHVVTNYHVVDAGRSRGTYSVTLYSQKTYDAQLLGGDPNKDIAVLRLIDCDEPLTPIRVLPQGGPLEVGQTAIAIGNPFGLDHTLTTGVVSAIGREVQGYGGVTIRDMIQTDASINPGNSGGPLLDSGAHLIGMNTMIFSKTGSSAGIGFAVPVAAVRRVVPQIIDKGRVEHPGLGIEPLPDAYAARVGVKGVVITRTVAGGPAAKAGIRGLSQDRTGELVLGDIIVGINEHKVRNYDDLYNALDRFKVGDEVEVKLVRDGAAASVKLNLIDLP